MDVIGELAGSDDGKTSFPGGQNSYGMRSTIADSINPKKLTAYDDYVAVICCGVKAHSHTFHRFKGILY